jgi:hypothetical protein
MALTKVKEIVADIASISNGTSDVSIASAGGDIVVTRGGTTIVTHSAAGSTYGAGLNLTVDNINSEVVQLGTGGGAELTFQTTLAQGELETTNAFPLVLGANNVEALEIATDGKVTLNVEGTGIGHLVTKAYVDAAATTASAQLSDMVFNAATPGSFQLPTDGANTFILNWGITASIANTVESVVFDTAFPNAVLGAFATRIAPASREDRAGVNSVTTTGMDVVQSGGNSSQVYWMAFGY